MDAYAPSETIRRWGREGRLNRCRGLSSLVGAAIKQGWVVAIDLSADGCGELTDWESVTAQNVRYAVHEVDLATLWFIKEGQRYAMAVVAENDDDWCADYTVCPLLEELAQKYT